MINVKIKPLHPDFQMPEQMTKGAAGFDVKAVSPPEVVWRDNNISYCLFKLGFALEVPKGYEAQLRLRSGLTKYGVIIPHGLGTIDSDYRGEVEFPLLYVSPIQNYKLYGDGNRIGQLVIQKLPEVQFELADELSETERGEGGFGSTGR